MSPSRVKKRPSVLPFVPALRAYPPSLPPFPFRSSAAHPRKFAAIPTHTTAHNHSHHSKQPPEFSKPFCTDSRHVPYSFPQLGARVHICSHCLSISSYTILPASYRLPYQLSSTAPAASTCCPTTLPALFLPRHFQKVRSTAVHPKRKVLVRVARAPPVQKHVVVLGTLPVWRVVVAHVAEPVELVALEA